MEERLTEAVDNIDDDSTTTRRNSYNYLVNNKNQPRVIDLVLEELEGGEIQSTQGQINALSVLRESAPENFSPSQSERTVAVSKKISKDLGPLFLRSRDNLKKILKLDYAEVLIDRFE